MIISWREYYQAAVVESDWTKIEEQIQTAEAEIHKRRLVLSQDSKGTQEESDALVHALNGLKTLRAGVASWRERQSRRNDL
jgi:hypothetical protein